MSTEPLGHLAELLPEPILLVSASGTIVAANGAAARALACESNSLVGRPLVDFFPDSVENVSQFLRACSRSHELLPGALNLRTGGESTRYRAAGALFRRRTLHEEPLVLLRLTRSESAASRFLGLNRQIEQLDAVQRQLKVRAAQVEQAERRLDAILNNATVAVFLMDEQQHCTYMNSAAEQLTGYTLDETRGRALHDVVHHTRPDGTRFPLEECPIDRAFPQNNKERGEEIFVHKDGSFYPIAFTASPIRDARARIVGTILEVRDIREEKRVRDELRASELRLREADRRKDEFLATLSHELRNPLAPIRNATNLLQRPDVAPEITKTAVQIIDRQSAHLALLLDDLLDVVRITRGKIALRKAHVTLQAVIDSAVETARPVISAHQQTLQVGLPPHEIALYADPLRLAQVLANLLTNAAKYSPPGNRIELTAHADADDVLISVRDNGIGIPAEMLGQIFEMFAQVDSAHERTQGGLGIGLAIVRGLVELHGGTVSASSGGRGLGSVFTVRLPMLVPTAAAVTAGTHMQVALDQVGRRILIADDNRDAALTLTMALQAAGHQVRVAHDGATAVSAAAEFHPDVALLDIGMPVLSGFDVARAVRAQPWGQHLALIALTGWGHEDTKRRALAAGFDRHLTKPVDLDALQEIITELVSLRNV